MKKRKRKVRKNASRSQLSRKSRLVSVDWAHLMIFITFFSLFVAGGLWRGASMTASLAFGCFMGFAGLHFIFWRENEFYRVICAVLGAVIGGWVATAESASAGVVAISIVSGFIVGFFAEKWAQYVSI